MRRRLFDRRATFGGARVMLQRLHARRKRAEIY
jgi:hypothetical protein